MHHLYTGVGPSQQLVTFVAMTAVGDDGEASGTTGMANERPQARYLFREIAPPRERQDGKTEVSNRSEGPLHHGWKHRTVGAAKSARLQPRPPVGQLTKQDALRRGIGLSGIGRLAPLSEGPRMLTPPRKAAWRNADSQVVLVTTAGRGSMDLYGRKLAAHLPVEALELDVRAAGPEVFNRPSFGIASIRAALADGRVVRRLRHESGLLHFAHHHCARYGNFLSVPYLVTVHDLIRFFDAQRLGVYINPPNLRDRLLLRLDYRAIKAARAVIAVSETTRRDLLHYLRLPADRVFVVYEGVDHGLFHPVRRRLLDVPYVLFVGSEHPRKNLGALLRAFAILKRDPEFQRLALVKVGKAGSDEADFRGPMVTLIRELGLERDVMFMEEVSDEDLVAYYSGAACFVLPSLYEGFGFAPLEAMACGCPVIVSTAGSLPEVVGDAGLPVSPNDHHGLASAVRTLLNDRGMQSELRSRGLDRARKFSWERTAEQTLRVYEATTERLERAAQRDERVIRSAAGRPVVGEDGT